MQTIVSLEFISLLLSVNTLLAKYKFQKDTIDKVSHDAHVTLTMSTTRVDRSLNDSSERKKNEPCGRSHRNASKRVLSSRCIRALYVFDAITVSEMDLRKSYVLRYMTRRPERILHFLGCLHSAYRLRLTLWSEVLV